MGTDYLNSGGDFNNVSTPTIYIKKLFDAETLKSYIPLLHDAVNNQKRDPNTKTIVECIVEVVMSRLPRIADLNMANQHHLRLSDKIHSAWDLAEKDNLPFSIMNCVEIARSHWAKVRESLLTMGPGTGGAI